MIILVVGGIVFAMIRWNRHPRVSFLTILGLGFYLLKSALFTFVLYLIPTVFARSGQMGLNETLYTVLYVIDDIAYAAVIVVLVSAVFTRRLSNSADPASHA
jgi:hypothetical protein